MLWKAIEERGLVFPNDSTDELVKGSWLRSWGQACNDILPTFEAKVRSATTNKIAEIDAEITYEERKNPQTVSL